MRDSLVNSSVPNVPSQAVDAAKEIAHLPEESHRTSHFHRGDLGGNSLTEGGATIREQSLGNKNGSEAPEPVEVEEQVGTVTPPKADSRNTMPVIDERSKNNSKRSTQPLSITKSIEQ